jgi:hypothetical protein
MRESVPPLPHTLSGRNNYTFDLNRVVRNCLSRGMTLPYPLRLRKRDRNVLLPWRFLDDARLSSWHLPFAFMELFLDPEDGGDVLLGYVGWLSTDWREYPSQIEDGGDVLLRYVGWLSTDWREYPSQMIEPFVTTGASTSAPKWFRVSLLSSGFCLVQLCFI